MAPTGDTISPRHTGRVRRRWLVAVVGLVAVAGLVSVGLLRLLPGATPAAPAETIWQKITEGGTDGPVSKETALEAFAYLYKVDIPSVTIPTGVEGGDEPSDGSGPMTWVQANWDSLTPAQQAVINRFILPGPNDRLIPANSTASAGTANAETGATQAPFRLAEAVTQVADPPDWPIEVDLAPDVSTALADAMVRELMADLAHIGPKLGMAVITPGSVLAPDISLIMSDEDGGGTLMETFAYSDIHNPFEPCRVTVYKNAWQNEQPTASGGVSATLHVLTTHEVVHCYQHVIWGSKQAAESKPDWIVEGSAMWLAADDTGIAEPSLAGMWRYSYFVPETPLTNRSYSSYGYFALLDHLGRNLWQLMLPAWQAAATSAQTSDAFIAVLQGDNLDVRNNWAESYLREDGWGNPWIVYGFGLPDDAQVYRTPAVAQADPGWQGSLVSRSNAVLSVNSSDGEVVTISTNGLASVHDDGTNTAVAFQDESFCTAAGGCVCPPGTLLAGRDMTQASLTMPFVAAFNAPEGGSKYSLVSSKLMDLCSRPATPAPAGSGVEPGLPGGPGGGTGSAAPCGSGCANSNGDPHLRSVNGQRYDLQAAGEFTLFRSPDGSVEIQAREEPWGSAGTISTNTAIAARVGGHRVGVYATSSGLVAHVDGGAVDLTSGALDLGGGSISSSPNGFEIDFPDGTKLWTVSVGIYGINALVKPSAALLTGGSGLLGPVAPGGLDVPNLPDGSRLPAPTADQQRSRVVNGRFADAWRITDATSLFDYDPGRSTASYTVKPYPTDQTYGSLDDLSSGQRAAGDSACSAITDAELHDDCVFDVGVSGDGGFAGGYGATQSFENGAPAEPAASPSASSTTPPSAINGAQTITSGLAIGSYALGPDGTVYLTAETSSGTYSLISFDPASGKVVHQVRVPTLADVEFDAGSVWLSGAGQGGAGCELTRFDAGTLAQQADLSIACGYNGKPQVAGDGGSVWFVDASRSALTRVDPSTNALGASLGLPFANGTLVGSEGAVFYGDTSDGYARLEAGSNAFESLGKLPGHVAPAANGLWVQSSDLTTLGYATSASGPVATIPIDGRLVGGDAQAAYVEVAGNDANGSWQPQLWRYPADGSSPTELAVPPLYQGTYLGFGGGTAAVVGDHELVKVWSVATATGQTQPAPILLVVVPLP